MSSVFLSNVILGTVSASVIVMTIEVISLRFQFNRVQRIVERMVERISYLAARAELLGCLEGRHYRELPVEMRVSYRTVKRMYARHVRRDTELKNALVARVSRESGRSFSVYDLYSALELGNVNAFSVSLFSLTPQLVGDMVRLSVLRSAGFVEEYRILRRRLQTNDPRCPGGGCKG